MRSSSRTMFLNLEETFNTDNMAKALTEVEYKASMKESVERNMFEHFLDRDTIKDHFLDRELLEELDAHDYYRHRGPKYKY